MMTENTVTPPAEAGPGLDDDQLLLGILLHAWDEYVATLKETKEPTKPMKDYARFMDIPETAPLVKLFGTFEAGMCAGLELAIKLDNIAKEKNTK